MSIIDIFFKGSDGINHEYKKDRKLFEIFINGIRVTTVIMRPNQEMFETITELKKWSPNLRQYASSNDINVICVPPCGKRRSFNLNTFSKTTSTNYTNGTHFKFK